MRLRKIVVSGQTYLWGFRPSYERDALRQWRCHDIFVAYLLENKRAPLRVHFVTWECPVVGGPLRSGAPVDLNNPASGGINLHQPAYAAQIIRQALLRGWSPSGNQALIIDDGLQLLVDIGYPVK